MTSNIGKGCKFSCDIESTDLNGSLARLNHHTSAVEGEPVVQMVLHHLPQGG